MRHISHFLALALAAPALAAPALLTRPGVVTTRLTGQQLIEHITPVKDGSRLDMQFQYQAEGYLAGIHDATDGVAWCDTGWMKPDELDTRIIMALRELPPEKLKGSAGPLVMAYLRAHFPCQQEPR